MPPDQPITGMKAILNLARLAALLQDTGADVTMGGSITHGAIISAASNEHHGLIARIDTYRLVAKSDLTTAPAAHRVVDRANIPNDEVGTDVKLMTVKIRDTSGVYRAAVCGIAFGVSVARATESAATVNGWFCCTLSDYDEVLGFAWQGASLGIAQSFIGLGHPALREAKLAMITTEDAQSIAKAERRRLWSTCSRRGSSSIRRCKTWSSTWREIKSSVLA